MNCPVCGESTNIIGSKSACDSVYRKRICAECGHIFYTEEYESDTSEKEYKRMMREYYRSIYLLRLKKRELKGEKK